MKNTEPEATEPYTINVFQFVMWLTAISTTLVGAYYSIKTGSLVAIGIFAFGLAMLWTGIGTSPSNPRTFTVVTFFGRRTNLFIREGLYLLPKMFYLNYIPVELTVKDVDFEIEVTTHDGQRIKGECSISFIADPNKFGNFLDVGMYKGVEQQLKGISELAVQKAIESNSWIMTFLETHLSTVSEYVYKILIGEIDKENRHNDVQELGIHITKAQVTLAPPKAIAEARETRKVVAELMGGVREQQSQTFELARQLQAEATGIPVTTGTPIEERFYTLANEIVQLALKQREETTIKGGGKPFVVAGGNK